MTPSTRALRLVAATATLQAWAVAVGAAASHALLGAATRALGPTVPTSPGAASDPALRVTAGVEALAWLGVTACSLWFLLAVAATARDLARHPVHPAPRSVRGCLRPALLRWLLVVLVGAGSGVPGPALVADGGSGWEVLDGLPLPELPHGAGSARPDPGRHGARPRTVRVRPGDCLWSIAADLLGPGATDGRVAQVWPVLHRANQSRIGPDPDLVLPGTTLRVPVTVLDRQHAGGAR